MSRTLSGLFLVGALNRPRKRKGTNRENPRTIPEQIGKIPEKSGKVPKRTKKEGQVQIGKPPRLKHPRLAALDFCWVESLHWGRWYRGNIRMYPRRPSWYRGNIRTYPRSGFWCRRTSAKTTPFGNHPFCEPPIHSWSRIKHEGALSIPLYTRRRPSPKTLFSHSIDISERSTKNSTILCSKVPC